MGNDIILGRKFEQKEVNGTTCRTEEFKAVVCFVRNDEDNSVLIMHGKPKPNGVNEGIDVGVGGKIESYQKKREAASAETFQESNLWVEPQDWEYKGYICNTIENKDEANKLTHIQRWQIDVYTANKFRGVLKSEDREGFLGWVCKGNFDGLNMRPSDKIFINNLFQPVRIYVHTNTTEYKNNPEKNKYFLKFQIVNKILASISECKNYNVSEMRRMLDLPGFMGDRFERQIEWLKEGACDPNADPDDTVHNIDHYRIKYARNSIITSHESVVEGDKVKKFVVNGMDLTSKI